MATLHFGTSFSIQLRPWHIIYFLYNIFFQEKSTFAKSCRKRGGYFKCCFKWFTLNTFETSRNRLIEEGLIKAKSSSWCKRGLDKEDPCYTCHTDALCTELDKSTGETKNTFLKGYKKDQMVKFTVRVCL